MPDAGEHHGKAAFVGGGDHVRVAHGAARLDDRGGAGIGRGEQTISEREERVGGDDRPASRLAASCFAAFAASCAFQTASRTLSTRLICPAPTPTVAPSFAKTIAFERTCFATRMAKIMSSLSCGVGSRLVTVRIDVSSRPQRPAS